MARSVSFWGSSRTEVSIDWHWNLVASSLLAQFWKKKKTVQLTSGACWGLRAHSLHSPSQRVCSKLFPPSAFHLREIFEVGFSERSNLNLKFAKFNLPRFRKRKPHEESFTFPINRTTLFLSLEGLLIRKFCRPVRILFKKYILLIEFTRL